MLHYFSRQKLALMPRCTCYHVEWEMKRRGRNVFSASSEAEQFMCLCLSFYDWTCCRSPTHSPRSRPSHGSWWSSPRRSSASPSRAAPQPDPLHHQPSGGDQWDDAVHAVQPVSGSRECVVLCCKILNKKNQTVLFVHCLGSSVKIWMLLTKCWESC